MSFNFSFWFAKNNFLAKRADFYFDLAEALDDNAVLVDTIRGFEIRAGKRKDVLQPLYALWLLRMDDRSFAKSLLGTVPDSDVMLLEAAEQSDQMADGLRFLARSIKSGEKMKKELIGAVSGPIFLLIMFVALLIGFSYFLVPVLTQIMKPETWPLIGKMLYSVSQIVTGYGFWLLGILILLISTYIWSLRKWQGEWRLKADRVIPFYSIYRDFVGSIFLVALAALMRSGIGLSEALDKLAVRASPWLLWHIKLIQRRLDMESDQPARAFDTGVFNRALTDRVIDYGSRSKFHEALSKVGIDSIDKVTGYVAASAMVLNRLLIFVCGATMIFMVAGVLLTAQEAQNSIMRQTFSVH